MSIAFTGTGCGVVNYYVKLEQPLLSNVTAVVPRQKLGIRHVVDARPDPETLGKVPGPYGPFGKIHFSKGTVFSEQFSEDLKAAVRAAGYELILAREAGYAANPQKTQFQGLLDVTLRDLTIEQFQEIFPSTLRVEARMLIEATLTDPATGQIQWSRVIRANASRDRIVLAARKYWESAVNEVYASCLQQLQEALASSEVRGLLARQID